MVRLQLSKLPDVFILCMCCRSGLEMLAKTPQDLEQLADAVVFHKKLSDDKARIAGRFEPLRSVVRWQAAA